MKPDYAEAYNNLGNIYKEQKNYKKAITNYKKAVKIKPNYYEAYNNLGVLYKKIKDYPSALKSIYKALDITVNSPQVFNSLASLYFELKDYQKSLRYFEKVLSIDPYNIEAYNNLSVIFEKKESYKNAERLLKKAIKISPDYYLTYYNLGNLFAKMNKYNLAKKAFERSIELNPSFINAFDNLAYLYNLFNKFSKAAKISKKSIKIDPNNPISFNNLGYALKGQKKYNKSKSFLEIAIKLNPDYAEAHCNLGRIFIILGNYEYAIDHLKKSINCEIKKNQNISRFFIIFLFNLNYSPNSSAEEVFSYYQQFDHKFGLPLQKEWQPFPLIKEPKSKLKIGYVSPDFKKHSVQHHLSPVLANHNHDQFEIYAFAELSEEDPITQQYKSYVDHWIPTQGLSDEEMVQKIRELQIDILVDLAGHTKDNRLLVFARKPAPVSLTWLGYGYTTGLSAIDYFLTDKITVPKGSEHLFSEQIWQLNHYGHCCYQEQLDMGDVGPLPALDKGHITFGTLTRAIRINDRVIKAWSQILKRVKHSKLVINSADFSHYKTKRMIISKFEEYGVKQNRLEVGYQSPPWDTMRQIDIALDCFPHNSGTTLIEHLYMGNPFVTYSNRPSVGKIGASILTALGREEWVAYSEQEYIDKAIALATDTKKLASIRSSLREEMKRSPIMDHKGFVLELERTYQSMWDKWCAASKINFNI